MTPAVDFVLLSDLHVSDRPLAEAGLLTDTGTTLAEAVAAIVALDPQPAFVVMAGDLTNHGEPASYRKLARLLEPLAAPRIMALGNHDTRAGFRAVMLPGNEAGEAPYCHDVVVGGVHVVVLDSSLPGRIAGALGPEQIAFLAEALEREPGLPKLVVCHHPPRLDGGEGGWDSLDRDSSDRLAETIRGRGVAGILSGHVHFDSVIHWHGVPVVIGTGLHNAVDVSRRGALRVVEGAGYTLCRLRPSGLAASFVPLTRSRRELVIHDLARLEAMDRAGGH